MSSETGSEPACIIPSFIIPGLRSSSAVDAAGLGGIAGFNEGNSLQDRATVSALLRRVINHQGARGVPFSSARRGAFGGGPDISPAIGSRAYFFVTL